MVPYGLAVRIPGFHPGGPRVQLPVWEVMFWGSRDLRVRESAS